MINENIRLVAGAARRWHLSLVREDSTPVDLSAYRFYGGAASRYRKEFRAMEVVSTTSEEVTLQLPALPYGERWHHQIYMQETTSAREWLILSGSIDVLERLGEDAAASTITEAESYLRCTLSATTDELEGTFLSAGPRGPQGEKGDKGDPGEPGEPGASLTYADLTPEQKEELAASVAFEEVAMTPAGTTEDNFDAYGFSCVATEGGTVTGLSLECRAGGSATPANKQIFAKVWRGNTEVLARSKNSHQHAVGATLFYEFEPFTVAAGEELRVTFHEEAGLAVSDWQMGVKCCMRAVQLTEGESGGFLNSTGGYSSTAWTAKYAWQMLVPRFAPAAHAEDSTAHLTATEHAGLAELLARKDELLALLA